MSRRAQLKTGIWIDALIRRAEVGGAFACVTERGDRDAGSVMVIVRGRDALTLYAPERDMDGVRVWRARRVDEMALAQAVKSRLDFDSDLNVVEIDDREGRHFIEETVLTDATATSSRTKESAQMSSSSEAQAAAVAAAKALFRGR